MGESRKSILTRRLRGTIEVCQVLGVTYWEVFNALRDPSLRPKKSNGRYWWSAGDIERLRAALARRRSVGRREEEVAAHG